MARERRKVKLVTATPPAAAAAAAYPAFTQSCKVYVISICDWKLSLCGRGDGVDEIDVDLFAFDECGRSVLRRVAHNAHTGETVRLALGQCVQFGPVHLIQVMFPLVYYIIA